ncbi:MAG: hypothetical protein ABMA64_20010 [Myxococcota bacterium]
MADPEPLDRDLDWLLLGRYGLLVALCALIPVPILDGWVENHLRRRLARKIAQRHGRTLEPEALALLADAPSGGCLGMVKSVVLWPVKKLLKTFSVVFQVKGITDTFSEVVHRGLMLEDAFEAGLLPGDNDRVRWAMDRALSHVDTRPIERALLGTLRDARHDLNRTIWEAVRVLRLRRVDALADAVEGDQLGATNQVSRAMVAALRTRGLVPELFAWFRAELGQQVLEPRLAGPIVPELVDRPPPTPDPALPMAVEDAVELPVEPRTG